MPELDCSTCTAQLQVERGCDGGLVVPVQVFGEDVFQCPRRPVLDDEASFKYWLGLYKNYRKGILPEPGSLMEQAAITLEVFDVLDGVFAQVEMYHRDKAAANQGGGAGSPPNGRRRMSSKG